MTRPQRGTPPPDLAALHGEQVTVEMVDVVEDADGIPSWTKVEREVATVVISPRLLGIVPQTREACVDTSDELQGDAPARVARTSSTASGGSRQPMEGTS